LLATIVIWFEALHNDSSLLKLQMLAHALPKGFGYEESSLFQDLLNVLKVFAFDKVEVTLAEKFLQLELLDMQQFCKTGLSCLV